MPKKTADTYEVQICDGTWHRSGDTFVRDAGAPPRTWQVYSGASLQFAVHDANTAKLTAILSGGSMLIVLRRGGAIVNRTNVRNGEATDIELLAPPGTK